MIILSTLIPSPYLFFFFQGYFQPTCEYHEQDRTNPPSQRRLYNTRSVLTHYIVVPFHSKPKVLVILADNFNILLGKIGVTVPWVQDGDDYEVVCEYLFLVTVFRNARSL